MALTRRQKQVLDFLVDFINKRGYSPSFEEIGKGMGLSSLATVHKHLQTLAKKGFVRRGYNQSRSLEVVAVPGSVPFAKTAVRPFGRRLTGRSAAAAGRNPRWRSERWSFRCSAESPRAAPWKRSRPRKPFRWPILPTAKTG